VLKPEVVVIERPGSPVVKGTDKDGYVLDASAPGMDKLRPGKIVLIKNEAAGRIKTLNRQGNDLHVTVDPVCPADVIQDGKISWRDVTFDPSAMSLAKWDDPNGVTQPKPESTSTPET